MTVGAVVSPTAPVLGGATLRTVVPGPGVPAGLTDRSNNNLDVRDHDGRRFLAWRSAPSHFASARAALHVVVSDDLGATWRHETSVAFGRDVREPRFFVLDGAVHLLCFEASTNPTRFEPGRAFVLRRGVDGRWSEPTPISGPGCVPWRAAWIDGRLALTVYRGAETLFTAHPEPIRVELWTTDDGLEWRPWDPERPVLHHGGTETDLVETGDGRVLYVCRKEGPTGGWGTDLGVAPVSDPLSVVWTPHAAKADSPCLVRTAAGVLLVARRQPAADGRFDRGLRRLSATLQTRLYGVRWWVARKRTAVWRIEPTAPGVAWTHLGDLPSRGDTAFAAVVAADGGDVASAERLTIYNYTSPVAGPDLPWCLGQLRSTQIVACDVTIDELVGSGAAGRPGAPA